MQAITIQKSLRLKIYIYIFIFSKKPRGFHKIFFFIQCKCIQRKLKEGWTSHFVTNCDLDGCKISFLDNVQNILIFSLGVSCSFGFKVFECANMTFKKIQKLLLESDILELDADSR
jgi:hypothetical protein